MDKCQLFNNIASIVWNEISNNHRRGNRLNEEGITRGHIIGKIQDYVEERHNFEIFAQKAKDEVNTGADLELYLQISHNSFVRILLQSKIMELNGTFVNLNRESGSTGRKQYETLIGYSEKVNAKPYYLFFNGIPDYYESSSDCAGEHDEKQYGCALKEASLVKKYCENNDTGSWGDLNELKPIGSPWRKLTCCSEINLEELKEYSFSEINADPYFKEIFDETSITSFITLESLEKIRRAEMSNFDVHKLGWSPFARIFLTTNHNKMMMNDGFLRIQM